MGWPEIEPVLGNPRFFLCNDRNPVEACIFYEEKEDKIMGETVAQLRKKARSMG